MVPGFNPQETYQVPIAGDGFVDLPSPNITPSVTFRPGIFVAGTAAGPMDIVDSIVIAGAAAAETAAFLESRNGLSQNLIFEKVPTEMEVTRV